MTAIQTLDGRCARVERLLERRHHRGQIHHLFTGLLGERLGSFDSEHGDEAVEHGLQPSHHAFEIGDIDKAARLGVGRDDRSPEHMERLILARRSRSRGVCRSSG